MREDDRIKYINIGNPDTPIYTVEYLYEDKYFKRGNRSLDIGWTYEVGTVTNDKGKKIDYETEFKAFEGSLEHLFDTLSNSLVNGSFGFMIEHLSKINFSLSTHTTATTTDKDDRKITYTIDSICGAIPYSVKIESIDGIKFKGKLPEKLEEHICSFNNLNNALKNFTQVPTYDRPKYKMRELYDEMFLLEDIISKESIEINNEISKEMDINLNKSTFGECEYDIQDYHIKEITYEIGAKTNTGKIALGNIEQYQEITKNGETIRVKDTFTVFEYDSKKMAKCGKDFISDISKIKTPTMPFLNIAKNINFSLSTTLQTTLKDKSGNEVEIELKLFGGNFPYSAKITKVNGENVTRTSKELLKITETFSKASELLKYMKENKDVEVHTDGFTNFLQKNYKRTCDILFELNDKLKTIDVQDKSNFEYITDHKLKNMGDREYCGVTIRTEKGKFTRTDKATFKSLDGQEVEIKINSYFNGKLPVLSINSINGKKFSGLVPLRLQLKDNSIDKLLITAGKKIEETNMTEHGKSLLSGKEAEKLLKISSGRLNVLLKEIANLALDKIPNSDILKVATYDLTSKISDSINETFVKNYGFESIHKISVKGKLTKEMIQGYYRQYPYLETIYNDGKKINVMDYIDETLEDKIKREQTGRILNILEKHKEEER